ncbi:MAG: hypothetical protein NUV56_03190 [Candidatus Uhrbacteria bacterium]|nr:hypothetical protein [Candidatus Uhrbacteria bacterium]
MRFLVFLSLSSASAGSLPPIDPNGSTVTPPRTASKPQSVKTCPVTSYGHHVYKFECNNGGFFPTELAEFLTERPTLAVQTVSPIHYYEQNLGYLVVTRTK